MGATQSKAITNCNASYMRQLLICGFISTICGQKSTANTPSSIIDLCKQYCYNSSNESKNLLYYIQTLHLIEIMDLNDNTFTKYAMNIRILNNNNNNTNRNEIEARIFNRCYCSYSMISNVTIQVLPKWIEKCFTDNNIKDINTSSLTSFYNIIFRSGGYYFNQTLNNINTSILSNDIEIIIFDTKELIFNNDTNNTINAYCISIPTTLPSRSRFKMLYNQYNGTLLFTPYLQINDNQNNNNKAFVYELNLENLKWKNLIKYNENNNNAYGSSLCLIENGTKLVQMGGVNELGEKLKSVTVYNYKNKKIELYPPMLFERNENLNIAYDANNNEIIVVGGLKDKYHENRITIYSITKQKWIAFNYIFSHNHREPLIYFDQYENKKDKQIIYIAGNELENWKRIGFVETIDTHKNYGKTIIGKYLTVGGGKENTLNKDINISIKQMFTFNTTNQRQQQLQQLFGTIFPRVSLLQSWL